MSGCCNACSTHSLEGKSTGFPCLLSPTFAQQQHQTALDRGSRRSAIIDRRSSGRDQGCERSLGRRRASGQKHLTHDALTPTRRQERRTAPPLRSSLPFSSLFPFTVSRQNVNILSFHSLGPSLHLSLSIRRFHLETSSSPFPHIRVDALA